MLAYIDARNERSKWMSEQFGFQTKAKLVTQTFSRIYPTKLEGLSVESIHEEYLKWIRSKYQNHTAYFEEYIKEGTIHCWRNPAGTLLALSKFTNVAWEISRLLGKWGEIFVKTLPYLPILRKLVNVNNHQFLVPEAVCLTDEIPKVLETFFSGVLHMEKRQMVLWRNDERNPLYLQLKDKMNWGIMHRIFGVSSVDVVIRGDFQPENPMYIAAFDMI